MIEKYALITVAKGILRKTSDIGIRDLSRELNIGASTTKTWLDYMHSQGLLTKRTLGKNILFRAQDTYLTRSVKILYTLSEIHNSGLVQELTSRIRPIFSILLFGSTAKGTDDEKSDLDILIISRKRPDLTDLRAERMLSREVSFVSYTYDEWKNKAKMDRLFYENVIHCCIPLYGEKPIVT